MQNLPSRTITGFEDPSVSQKYLMLKDHKAIRFLTYHESRRVSVFLEENILLFVVEGTICIRFGKLEYNLSKNQMVFLKKDTLIEYQTGGTRSGGVAGDGFILVSLKYELVKEFAKMADLPVGLKADGLPITFITADKQLLKFMDSLEPFFIEPKKFEHNLLKIKLLELLFYLSGSERQMLEQVLDVREHYRNNITDIVEKNIMNSVSLNQLAVLAGRSLSSFRRDFLAIYNMPPSKWIRQKRLEKAQELLSCTTMTVTDICYSLGFENITHFSRLFKSKFGYPPSEFRMNRLVS